MGIRNEVGRAKPRGTGVPPRRSFRARAVPGEALAMDPGAGGVIAAAMRGVQPSPHAFGIYYDPGPTVDFDPKSVIDGVAVLCVGGPLEHHVSWWWATYDNIIAAAEAALKHGEVRALVLLIDSPGGVAAGMGEAHRRLREMQVEFKKPIYAFANEMACSAAYALASACREVWTTEAGHVGSVGVILGVVDESAYLEKMGIKMRYVVSGARKADMHPGAPITDDVLEVAQTKVDKLAAQFFALVAKARAKAPEGAKLATPKAVQALQAGVFVGGDAVAAGLADGIASWRTFLGYVKSAVSTSPQP